MSHILSHSAAEQAHLDFGKSDHEEDWYSVEARYPEFSSRDVQEYLDAIKVAERRQVFGDYAYTRRLP